MGVPAPFAKKVGVERVLTEGKLPAVHLRRISGSRNATRRWRGIVDSINPSRQAKAEGKMVKGANGTAFDYYPRLKRLREYVEQNYSEPIPLEKAAGIAILESSYFSCYFHVKVGITFTEWLRQVRIKKAMELIKASDFSITEVAYEVGFVSLGAFERAFKKHTRITPMRFKKSVAPA